MLLSKASEQMYCPRDSPVLVNDDSFGLVL